MGVSIIGYKNLLDTGTVTASSEETDYEKENAYDDNTYDAWKPSSVSAWLKVDMGSATPCDYWAVYSDNISDQSAIIEFQYSDNDADWTTIGVSVTPNDNKPLIKIFSQVSHRYYRLLMTGAACNINVISFGEYTALPRGMPIGFEVPSMSRESKLVNSISEGGNILSNSRISTGFEGAIIMSSCPASWFRTYWEDLAEHLETRLAFFQWNDAKYPNESVVFRPSRKLSTPGYDGHRTMGVTIRIIGLNR